MAAPVGAAPASLQALTLANFPSFRPYAQLPLCPTACPSGSHPIPAHTSCSFQFSTLLQEKSKLYLIMEFCSGGDLAHYIRAHRGVPEATAQHFMQQLAAGLKEMWAHHLVHVRRWVLGFFLIFTLQGLAGRWKEGHLVAGCVLWKALVLRHKPVLLHSPATGWED